MGFLPKLRQIIGRIMMQDDRGDSQDPNKSSGEKLEHDRQTDSPDGGNQSGKGNKPSKDEQSDRKSTKDDDESRGENTDTNDIETEPFTISNTDAPSDKSSGINTNKLEDKELKNWAEASVDKLLSENKKGVSSDPYDPDRLEQQIRKINPDNIADLQTKIKQSMIVFRRRGAYINELEDRLVESDQRISELKDHHDQQQSQLNSLVNQKENKIDELRTYGHESLAAPIIFEVREDLIGAISHDDAEKLREASKFALADLEEVLERNGIKLLEPKIGAEFDHKKHKSVGRVPDQRPEQTIVSLQRPGFAIEGSVREKAKVVVSDGTGESQSKNENKIDEGGDNRQSNNGTVSDNESERDTDH